MREFDEPNSQHLIISTSPPLPASADGLRGVRVVAAQSRHNQVETNVKSLNQTANPAAPEGTAKQQPSPAKPKAAAKKQSAPKTKESAQHQTKQDRVVAMLRGADGTSVAAVMKATGWQKHSVHGFFAGVVRKKLRFNLVSDATGGKRIYRIVDNKRAKGSTTGRKRAA